MEVAVFLFSAFVISLSRHGSPNGGASPTLPGVSGGFFFEDLFEVCFCEFFVAGVYYVS